MLAVSVLLAAALTLVAQDQRPSEAEMFGTPAQPEAQAAPAAPAPGPSAEVPEDPLRIGGQFYLRTQTLALEEQAPRDWAFTAPSLLDVYGDARPNPRVRGYVLGRMFYDPTRPVRGAADPTAA